MRDIVETKAKKSVALCTVSVAEDKRYTFLFLILVLVETWPFCRALFPSMGLS